MATVIICGSVFLLCFSGAWLRVLFQYYAFALKGYLIPLASTVVVSLLTAAGTFRIRKEVTRYVLTLGFTFLQVFIHFFVETYAVWVESFAIFSVGAIFGIRCLGQLMQNKEHKGAAGEAGHANREAVQEIEDRIREAIKFIIFNYIAAFCITLISMILNIKCIRIKKNHEDNIDKILNTDASRYNIPVLLCLAVPFVIGNIPLYWNRVLQFLAWCNTQRQVFHGWCNNKWQEFQGWWIIHWEQIQAWRNAQMEKFQNWWNNQMQSVQNCWAGLGNWWNVQWEKMTGVGRSPGNDERVEEESAGGVVELEQVGTHAGGVVERQQAVTEN